VAAAGTGSRRRHGGLLGGVVVGGFQGGFGLDRKGPIEHQPLAHSAEQVALGGMPEAVVADLVKALGQDVLAEAAQELMARHAAGAPLAGFAVQVTVSVSRAWSRLLVSKPATKAPIRAPSRA